MEVAVLSLILGGTVFFTANYFKRTVKVGELCQSCPNSSGGCSSKAKVAH